MNCQIEIQARGLAEDLKPLVDALCAPQGESKLPGIFGNGVSGLELVKRVIDPLDDTCETLYGCASHIPGADGFDALFAAYCRLSFYIVVKAEKDTPEDVAFWKGVDGILVEHRRFNDACTGDVSLAETFEAFNEVIDNERWRWGLCWQYLPKTLRTKAKALYCIEHEPGFQDQDLPYEYWRDPEFACDAFLIHIENFEMPEPVHHFAHYNEKIKTPELCLETVKMDGRALRFVPEPDRMGIPQFIEICHAAVRQNGLALRYAVEPLMKAAGPQAFLPVARDAVRQNGIALKYVGETLFTALPEQYWEQYEDLCLEAVKQNGWALHYVPEFLKTEGPLAHEICLAAVQEAGTALGFVPEALKMRPGIGFELCLEAIKQDSMALGFVPETLWLQMESNGYSMTPEEEGTYLNATRERIRFIRLRARQRFRDIQDEEQKGFETYELCLDAVKRDGSRLRDVPEKFKTVELCLEAVKEDGWAFKYVPEAYRSKGPLARKICLTAIAYREGRYSQSTLVYVPEDFWRDKQFCVDAVERCGLALAYVPEQWRNADLCFTAVKQDGRALADVPEELRKSPDHGPTLCFLAVEQNGWALESVPEELLTMEMCLEAIKEEGVTLENIPEAFKTTGPEAMDIYRIAMEKDSGAIQYMPEELKTKAMYLEAVKLNGNALKFVPEELKTAEVYLEAVKKYGWVLEQVPEHLRTAELCLEAVKQYGYALKYVPENLKARIKESIKQINME